MIYYLLMILLHEDQFLTEPFDLQVEVFMTHVELAKHSLQPCNVCLHRLTHCQLVLISVQQKGTLHKRTDYRIFILG